MKTLFFLAATLGCGALLWALPGLELPASAKWSLGCAAFVAMCVLVERVPLALHLVGGWALVVATLYLACYEVPLEEKTLGESYLIFYYHFPSALTCLTLFVVAGVVSILQLGTGSLRLDARAVAAIEIGVLACTVTLATGMVWAEAAWGRPWVWHDKRLLTVAIMWFTYVAYLLFRLAVENPVKRARFASVLGIIFALNVPLVWYAIRWFGEVSHPMSLEMTGVYRDQMNFTKWFGFVAFFVLYHALWRWNAATHRARAALEELEERFAAQRI